MTDASLDALFNPGTAAIIGASTDPFKFGGLSLHYSKLRNFAGRLCPVNARVDEVQGLPAFPSVRDIDGPVDCAVVSVPAAGVFAALEDCAAKGVRAAIIFSSGYAEAGEDGRREQLRIAALGREAGMRILGPNCMGSFDLHSGFIATFTSAYQHYDWQGWPDVGPVGIVSQSGAVGTHIMVQLRERGIGLSKWLTTGNQCDVDVADGIAHMAADAETRVIVTYMEGCPDGPKLVRALEAARAARKPVLALKVGATEAGAAAAASHTASLAGANEVFDAVFRQHNVFRASTFPELLDVAAGCALGAFPAGPRVGIVSISGGVGALMADASESAGVELQALSDAAQRKILDIVPFAAPRNPVDTAAPGMSDMTIAPRFGEVVLEDNAADSLAIFMSHIGHVQRREEELYTHFFALRRKFPDAVMALSMMMPPEMRAAFTAEGFLIYDDPTATIRALGALARLAEGFEAKPSDPPPSVADAPPPGNGPMGELAAMRLIGDAGIPVVEQRLAASADEAAAHAEAMGFPVALKIASADIAHKSDIGGVLLGVADADAARAGYETLIDRAGERAPGAALDGVLVARMVAGDETILGVQRDPVFGPVVMFGVGGVLVEVYRDVAFRLAPFGPDEARAMIAEVRGAALLYDDFPPADIDAIADALARLSAYAHEHRDTIETIDVNPFIVLAEGDGAVAVDALIVGRG